MTLFGAFEQVPYRDVAHSDAALGQLIGELARCNFRLSMITRDILKAGDVTDTLEMALAASGLDRANVRQRPRLLSDNGSSYVARDLADWMSEHDMKCIRGAPIIQ